MDLFHRLTFSTFSKVDFFQPKLTFFKNWLFQNWPFPLLTFSKIDFFQNWLFHFSKIDLFKNWLIPLLQKLTLSKIDFFKIDPFKNWLFLKLIFSKLIFPKLTFSIIDFFKNWLFQNCFFYKNWIFQNWFFFQKLKFSKFYLSYSAPPFTKWFPGGRLSLCYNAVDRHVDEGRGETKALIWDSPITNQKSQLTYSQLKDNVTS